MPVATTEPRRCRHWRRNRDLFVSLIRRHEINPRTQRWLQGHLKTCRWCSADYAAEKQLRRSVRRRLIQIRHGQTRKST
jgi:hypothetical protein